MLRSCEGHVKVILRSCSRELEWAKNIKLGTITGNDVQMLLKEYYINRPHGGAVINAQTRDFGKATPLAP